jgi:hypothetical protein
MYESEMHGVSRKSGVKSELLVVLGEGNDLKIEEKWSPKASGINFGIIIILSPT